MNITPIFGINSLKCNDYNPEHVGYYYHRHNGYYITYTQFQCNTDDGFDCSNAVFYTDSLNFSVFIGIYKPGSYENNYKVERKGKNDFIFYNITDRQKVRTVKFKKIPLEKLKKGELIEVCNPSKK
jgi:hypothetical protein